MGGVVVRRRTIRRFWGLGRAPVYRGWENRNFVRPISVAFFPSMLPRTWSFSQSSWLPDRVRALRSGGWLGIGRQLYVPVSMQPSPHRHCLWRAGLFNVVYSDSVIFLASILFIVPHIRNYFNMLNSLFNSGGCFNLTSIRERPQIDLLSRRWLQ